MRIEHVDNLERIASRRRPAFSSYLFAEHRLCDSPVLSPEDGQNTIHVANTHRYYTQGLIFGASSMYEHEIYIIIKSPTEPTYLSRRVSSTTNAQVIVTIVTVWVINFGLRSRWYATVRRYVNHALRFPNSQKYSSPVSLWRFDRPAGRRVLASFPEWFSGNHPDHGGKDRQARKTSRRR